MKTLLVLALALLTLGAQPPSPAVTVTPNDALAVPQSPDDIDTDGHLKSEHRIPANHFCMSAQVYEENRQRGHAAPNAHPCPCTYSCTVLVGADGKPQLDVNGQPIVGETGGEKSTACMSYCEVDGRKCSCHPEPICDLQRGEARFDMHHHVVAMARARR